MRSIQKQSSPGYVVGMMVKHESWVKFAQKTADSGRGKNIYPQAKMLEQSVDHAIPRFTRDDIG